MHSIEYVNSLNSKIQNINNRILIEQSKLEVLKKQQEEILKKYNLSTKEELIALKNSLEIKLNKEVQDAENSLLIAEEHLKKLKEANL